jgi:hypothetical protein
MLPAEHRALRELHATAKQVEAHWSTLAARLGGPAADVLTQGVGFARELLRELETRIPGKPAAQGVGANLASLRHAGDLLLERNQAFRTALLDLQHVTTLLGYTRALAGGAAWQEPFEERGKELEIRTRAAINAMANDPEQAIAPADPSGLGRAGARLGDWIGTVGEAIDTRLARRRST